MIPHGSWGATLTRYLYLGYTNILLSKIVQRKRRERFAPAIVIFPLVSFIKKVEPVTAVPKPQFYVHLRLQLLV